MMMMMMMSPGGNFNEVGYPRCVGHKNGKNKTESLPSSAELGRERRSKQRLNKCSGFSVNKWLMSPELTANVAGAR